MVYPDRKGKPRYHQNRHAQKQHFPKHGLYFRKQIVYIGNNKHTSLGTVRKLKIHLLDQMLTLAVQIDPTFHASLHHIKIRKLSAERRILRFSVRPVINDRILTADNQIGILFI